MHLPYIFNFFVLLFTLFTRTNLSTRKKQKKINQKRKLLGYIVDDVVFNKRKV